MADYSYRQRSRERKLRKRHRIFVGAGVLVCLLVIVGGFFLIKNLGTDNDEETDAQSTPAVQVDDSGVIVDDVYIESVSVGGMDYESAVKAVDDFVSELSGKELSVDVNGNTITTKLNRLGFNCETGDFVDKAFALEEAGKVNLEFSLDDDKLLEFIDKECSGYTNKAKNAGLKRKNGEFIITESENGQCVDESSTARLIMDKVDASVLTDNPLQVTAVIVDDEPKYTSEDMSKCKDVIGKFSTKFTEGAVERSANLRNAVSFVNGNVIYPGDTFSVAKVIYPLTADNGYKEAPSYVEGEVVDSLGGGVCQVSTTLYNALLRAEVEIVERSPHSMVVSYVEPSMDAAIAGDYKDLKFNNNTETPIYIQGVVSSGILTFTVYGCETRPSTRTIEFKSEKVETIDPGKDIVTKDKTKPNDYKKVTQEAHVGYIANLYKIVYENGTEVSRDKINYSKYNAVPRHVTVGTKKKKDDKDKDKDKDSKNKDNNKATKEPDATLEPAAATEAPVVATEAPVVNESPVVPTGIPATDPASTAGAVGTPAQ